MYATASWEVHSSGLLTAKSPSDRRSGTTAILLGCCCVLLLLLLMVSPVVLLSWALLWLRSGGMVVLPECWCRTAGAVLLLMDTKKGEDRGLTRRAAADGRKEQMVVDDCRDNRSISEKRIILQYMQTTLADMKNLHVVGFGDSFLSPVGRSA